MERVPSAEAVDTLVEPLSNLSVRNATDALPVPSSTTSVPVSAQMLDLGPLPCRSGTQLSILSAAAPGASNAPPPTPATVLDSPSAPQPSTALRGCADELTGVDALLAAAQLRATNDAMLRALLPSIRREAVEMALTRFAKMRVEGDVIDTEHALAQEVRRLQDGVTTGYIARAREGDVGVTDRQVPPDLSQRMDDLETQSRKSTDTAVDRAEGELEAMAKRVGEQGDPHNSADLVLAKRVQASMQTLQHVREEHVAMENERLNRAAAMLAQGSELVTQEVRYPSHSQQIHGAQAPVAGVSVGQSAGTPSYEQTYPAVPGVEMERPPYENGYRTRPPESSATLYPVRDVAQVTVPFAHQDRRQELAAPSAGLYSHNPDCSTGGPYPAPSSYPVLTSEPSQVSYPAPVSYSATVQPQHGPPPRNEAAEQLLSQVPYPTPTSHQMPKWSQGAPSRNEATERLPPQASYPTPSSYPAPHASQQGPPLCDETSGRMASGVHISQKSASNEPGYPAGVSSEPVLPSGTDPRVDQQPVQFQQPLRNSRYPCDQQANRVLPPPKQNYPGPVSQTDPEHASIASRVRPAFPNAEPHAQVPYSSTTSTTPEPYVAAGSHGPYQQPGEGQRLATGPHNAYQLSEDRHRPLYTSDPPGFQESSSSYSALPQPPSPDVRTPPPEYASGRPHSLSHLDYSYAAQYSGPPASSSVYPPGRTEQSLLPQYPPGVFTASTAGPEPPRYPRNPDVYQPPHPEELTARPPYPNGYASPGQPCQSPNLYSDALTQGAQPSLQRSRLSLPAYASGYNGNSLQQYPLQSYPQPLQHGSQPMHNSSSPYNAAPGYAASQSVDNAILRRASTHNGSGHYAAQPPRYGGNGTAVAGVLYGREQRPPDPRLVGQSQNHPGFPLNQSILSQGQPSYPQQRTSYVDIGARIQAGPQQPAYTSHGYASLGHLQNMTQRQQIQGITPMGSNLYNPVPQPSGFGQPGAAMAQPTLPGMMRQGQNMMGAPGMVGGVSGLPPGHAVPDMGAPGSAVQHLANQAPQAAGQISQYSTVGPALGHRLSASHIPGRNPQLTAQSLDGMMHSFQRL